MTRVKGNYPDHILSLLGLVMDAVKRDVHEVTLGAGARSVPLHARGLRSSQLRLLSMTPVEGMRVTDLADRVGMTKQALGEFANVLEDKGLMESLRDPADRRVRILRPTKRGLRAVVAGEGVIADLEEEWRDRVGDDEWERLRELLIAVHNDALERRTR